MINAVRAMIDLSRKEPAVPAAGSADEYTAFARHDFRVPTHIHLRADD
jgi:hypothetical protein